MSGINILGLPGPGSLCAAVAVDLCRSQSARAAMRLTPPPESAITSAPPPRAASRGAVETRDRLDRGPPCGLMPNACASGAIRTLLSSFRPPASHCTETVTHAPDTRLARECLWLAATPHRAVASLHITWWAPHSRPNLAVQGARQVCHVIGSAAWPAEVPSLDSGATSGGETPKSTRRVGVVEPPPVSRCGRPSTARVRA